MIGVFSGSISDIFNGNNGIVAFRVYKESHKTSIYLLNIVDNFFQEMELNPYICPTTAAFSSSGEKIAVGTSDGTIYVYDVDAEIKNTPFTTTTRQ